MPSIMKIALPALAAAGSAYGASCTVSGTTTVQNAGDATGLASCTTFSGSIAVATGTTDDIVISGVKTLNGNLIVDGAMSVKRVSAGDLEQLNGELRLNDLTRLYAVELPKLKSIDFINFTALPNVQTLGFTAEVETAKKVSIVNTALRSLTGINITQATTIRVTNNGYINEISMQLGNVTDLTFADNNKAVNITLPNLTSATNLEFRSCGSVLVPSLQKLNGSLTLYNNAFEKFAAPNLTEIDEALAVVGNDKMSNLSFPLLTKISDNLAIANNTALLTIDGFPLLKSIGGAYNITGNMSEVDTPVLDDVKGAFYLLSTDNVTAACSFYQPLKDKKLIRGSYTCKGKLVDPGNSNSKTTDGSSSSTKASAASTLSALNGALGLAAMAAVLLL